METEHTVPGSRTHHPMRENPRAALGTARSAWYIFGQGRCGMRVSVLGVVTFAFVVPSVLALYSCGGGGSGGGLIGNNPTHGMDAGTHSPDATRTNDSSTGMMFGDAGGTFDTAPPVPFMSANFQAPDCTGCTFPPTTATACPSTTPPIAVVYPPDGVLVPPNMNVISVMWTPYGTPFQEFEVDFENSVTDMRVVTKCAAETMDTEQPSQASGGCELDLDTTMWNFIANQNAGGEPVAITVRGTVDGMCASTSTNANRLSFTEQPLLGALYYWKSTVSASGTGGQIG